ncbi:MAG: hypothetical protein ACRD0Y_11935 [Terriglobales bacterium]
MVQQNLIRRLLEKSGHRLHQISFVPLPAGRGAGEQYVRERFPELARQAVKTGTWLIVMIDADMRTTAARRRQLWAGEEEPADQVLILVPKRHVETWIRYALGERVDELVEAWPMLRRIADA